MHCPSSNGSAKCAWRSVLCCETVIPCPAQVSRFGTAMQSPESHIKILFPVVPDVGYMKCLHLHRRLGFKPTIGVNLHALQITNNGTLALTVTTAPHWRRKLSTNSPPPSCQSSKYSKSHHLQWGEGVDNRQELLHPTD